MPLNNYTEPRNQHTQMDVKNKNYPNTEGPPT